MQKILIAAGGTGGHIFPALAVAEVLQTDAVDVRWLGAKTGLEQKLVKDKFHLYSLSIQALRGKSVLKKAFALIRLVKAVIQALSILKSYKPDALLAMGGYASAPGVIAAWLLRIPIIIHEQNARAGLTNKYLSKLATKVLAGFPAAFAESKAEVVGNPVRQDFIALPEKVFSDTRPLRVLVVGGSQGAKFFNDNFPALFADLSSKRHIDIKQQTGVKQLAAVTAAYASLSCRAEVVAFIDDMAAAYIWADIIIARCGASTVAEVAAAGMPAIFVPFPAAVDDHQYYNAMGLMSAGAAIIARQDANCIKNIISYILELNSAKLFSSALAARTVAKTNATADIVAICREVMGGK